ncbi:MAG TPA: hypothetical protein VFQ61_16950, partial [Polyangiaceae bacterium]|nr:hypothetical protein [Polyangiaceae bacterium]
AKGSAQATSSASGVILLLDTDDAIAVGDGLYASDPITVSGRQMPRAEFVRCLRVAGRWTSTERGYTFEVRYPFLPLFALIRRVCRGEVNATELAFFRFFDARRWLSPRADPRATMESSLEQLSRDLPRFCEYLITSSETTRSALLHRFRAGASGWAELATRGPPDLARTLCDSYIGWLSNALPKMVDNYIWGSKRVDMICLEGFLFQTACGGGLRLSDPVRRFLADRPWFVLLDLPQNQFYDSVPLSIFWFVSTRKASKSFPCLVVVAPTALNDPAHLHNIERQLLSAGVAQRECTALKDWLRRSSRWNS